jgi:hypothetical protein
VDGGGGRRAVPGLLSVVVEHQGCNYDTDQDHDRNPSRTCDLVHADSSNA